MTLSKGTAVDGKDLDVHEAATASTGDEFEKKDGDGDARQCG